MEGRHGWMVSHLFIINNLVEKIHKIICNAKKIKPRYEKKHRATIPPFLVAAVFIEAIAP
jgi:hypothetical protein